MFNGMVILIKKDFNIAIHCPPKMRGSNLSHIISQLMIRKPFGNNGSMNTIYSIRHSSFHKIIQKEKTTRAKSFLQITFNWHKRIYDRFFHINRGNIFIISASQERYKVDKLLNFFTAVPERHIEILNYIFVIFRGLHTELPCQAAYHAQNEFYQ